MWNRCAMAGAIALLAGCSDLPTSTQTRAADSNPDAAVDKAVPAASVVFKTPEESPGPPFWTILANGPFLPHDGTWAAVPFLRELGCVPPAADLTVIVGPAAFGCSLTVEGHEHWQNGPGIDPAPRQTVFRGLGAVPIVFAHVAEVQAAMAGGLTLPELLALPSAELGYADRYKETDILGVSGPLGLGRGMYKITARGRLEDGTPFELHVNEVLGELQQVRIEFGP